MSSVKKNAVLFVCLGNICRSPTAHGIFQSMASRSEASDTLTIDSCGTGDWHIGHAPDSRAQSTAADYGYDLSPLRARQLSERDFQTFDYIFAMDRQNLADIEQWKGRHSGDARCELFLDFAFNGLNDEDPQYLKQKAIAESYNYEVPDPYYGEDDGFKVVVELLEAASCLLLQRLEKEQ